ncbi:MAG TPA: serine/threonine-protein kinase, partial [Sandaracinaceae bacterium]
MSAALGSDSFDIDLELEGSQAGVAPIGVGVVVARRYRLEGVIGRGAIATVWRAHDLLLHRPVALKVLAPSPDDDDEVASYDRFLREARLCAAIRHPNVVDLLDVGTCEGRPFLVMEMLEGEPLDRLLSRVVQFGVEEAVSIAVDVLDGLAAAHDRGIVHRDLKPANVFVVREGGTMRAKILDFGLSRSVDRSRRSARTTVEGQIFGTPAYMSPEQARGSHALDARTDLYSAAVVLYECLAGVLPYESEALGDLIVEIVTREPPPLSRIRPDVGPVSDVLARAMAHRPEDRFASAREMKAALLDALER